MAMRDSISSLPDEILGKILSLVPTKVVASTSVLSKRWRNLLCLVDNLSFDESMVVYPNGEEEAALGSYRFLEFVEKTLALLSNSHIKKFSLSGLHRFRSHPDGMNEHHRVNRWVTSLICTAMQSGILELYLHGRPRSCLELETELLTSKTLVKLTLSGACSTEVKRMFFPALKSLSLLSVSSMDYPNYSRLLDGCPVLEELYIRDGDYCQYAPGNGMDVQSASIKRLVIFANLPDCKVEHDVVYFQTPNLVYLDYSSYVSEKYLFGDLDSLVEVRLSLRLWEPYHEYYDYSDDDDDDDYYYPDDNGQFNNAPKIFGDVTDLLAGISHIISLHLSLESLEAFHFCCISMPMFNNLLNLSIESKKEKGWQVMPLLLKSCPNLHTLVIKGLEHRVTNRCGDACACIPKKKRKISKVEEELCCLRTCQVKVLEILHYGGSFQELKQMRHFLGKLKCLETVKVDVDADNNNREFLQANLLTLPRVSPKCIIHFI